MALAVAASAAALAAGTTATGAATPAPAQAPQASLTLFGRGNGHGWGMSQWGAYGYAVDFGWSAAQILDHYYGGTRTELTTETTMRVRLQALDDAQTVVVHDGAELVVDGGSGGPYSLVVVRETSPGLYTAWGRVWSAGETRACPSASDPLAGWQVVVTGVGSVTVRTRTDASASQNVADLLAVCEPGGLVRSYRGVIQAVNGSDGENRTVNEVPLEQYLRPIVASEMSPSWANAGGGRGAQALQVQAVAARSFGLAEQRYTYAKTCDLICQRYPGAARRASPASPYVVIEHPLSDAAVAATAGQVRVVSATGKVALTAFAASTGGWTQPLAGMPFPAVEDLGDATALNPAHTWTVTIPASTIEARWPSIGSFTGISVTERNGLGDLGGRVRTLIVRGTAGSVTVTGDQFRSALQLRSTWFAVDCTPGTPGCERAISPTVGGAATARAVAARIPTG